MDGGAQGAIWPCKAAQPTNQTLTVVDEFTCWWVNKVLVSRVKVFCSTSAIPSTCDSVYTLGTLGPCGCLCSSSLNNCASAYSVYGISGGSALVCVCSFTCGGIHRNQRKAARIP
jgi:hypothetical protein